MALALLQQAKEAGLRSAVRGLWRFAAGIACVLVPCAAYFAWQDALDDLWRYYLLAGFRYGAAPLTSSALFHPNADLIAQFTPGYLRFHKLLPSGFFIIVAIAFQFGGLVAVTLRRKAWLPCFLYAPATLWASWFLCLIAIFRGPYAYYHYFITFLPFAFLTALTVGVSFFSRQRDQGSEFTHTPHRFAAWAIPCILTAVLLLHMAKLSRRLFEARHLDDAAQVEVIHDIMSSCDGSKPTMLTLHPYVAVFHRVSPHRPANRNAFPQMTARGRSNWQLEASELLERAVPRYVLAVTDAAGVPRLDNESEHLAIPKKLLDLLDRRYTLKKVLSFAHVPAFQYVGLFERKASG